MAVRSLSPRFGRWLVILAILFHLAAPVAAEEVLACRAEIAGVVACLAGKLCTCGYRPGTPGIANGFRWDCGMLRPACGEAIPPATLDVYPYPLPPGLSLEQTDIDLNCLARRAPRGHNHDPQHRR
jgi:hypothetical protein